MDEDERPRGFLDPALCWACDGIGYCLRCKGNGRYVDRDTQAWVNCVYCGGSGTCRSCNGTGQSAVGGEDDEA